MKQDYMVRLWEGTTVLELGPFEALHACEALEIGLNETSASLRSGSWKAEVNPTSYLYAIQFDFVI